VRQLARDAAEVLADVHHAAILELVALEHFRPDSRWIARVLGLSPDRVNIALQRLLRLGLLEMSGRDRWVDCSGATTVALGVLAFLQAGSGRGDARPGDVYQLEIGFFSLTTHRPEED
jgi:hypothetical protein